MKSVFPAYASVTVFTVGHGLISTWVAVRLAELNADSVVIGMVTASYFLGIILGAFFNIRLIGGVGHIRAFAAYASVLSVSYLCFSFSNEPLLWIILRLVGGFATGGLLLVIESWILLNSNVKSRGHVMAIYMLLFYGAMSFGQGTLGQIPAENSWLISAFASIAVSLAVLPMAMTQRTVPSLLEMHPMSVREILKTAPAGSVSCFSAGVFLGLFYAFLPAFLLNESLTREDVARYVAISTLGGMLLQYPLGRLSDFMDRRIMLQTAAALIIVITLVISFAFSALPPLVFASVIFLLGGVLYAIYPVSLSLVCDQLPQEKLVSANQSVLVAYALGSIFGPLLISLLLQWISVSILFDCFWVSAACLLIFLQLRRQQRPAVEPEEVQPFVASPPISPLIAELDPRHLDMEKEEPVAGQ